MKRYLPTILAIIFVVYIFSLGVLADFLEARQIGIQKIFSILLPQSIWWFAQGVAAFVIFFAFPFSAREWAISPVFGISDMPSRSGFIAAWLFILLIVFCLNYLTLQFLNRRKDSTI